LKYTGRLAITLVLFLIIFLWHLSYFIMDKASSMTFFITNGLIIYDFIYTPLLCPLVWWLGKQYDRANYYSNKDDLTGAYNRRYVVNFFPKLSALIERRNEKLILCVIDVNNFKWVNDTYGHDAGDKVLLHLSNLLASKVRKSDILVRWGGDEFVIIAPFVGPNSTEILNRRFMYEINEILLKELCISISIGTALYPGDADNLHALIKIADQNMYELKSARKKTVEPPSF
jgi:diguanylate cyclase (GGDEF)-like protein